MVNKFNKNKYVFIARRGLSEIGEKLDKVRGHEISLLRKEAYLYDVHVKELSGLRLEYKEREKALNIALYVIEDEKLLENFREKRKLSISDLSRKTKIKKEFLNRWYGYIVLYIIMFSNLDYKNIQNYVKIAISKGDSNITDLENGNNKIKGIVIKINSKSINVLTSTGEIKRLKKEETKIGAEYEGIEKDFFHKNRFKILMISTFIAIITGVIFYQYNTITTTLILETTSKVKMETNRFNRVLYSYSGTEKGEKMLTEIKVNGESIDNAILEIIEYASVNKMKPEQGYTMTINGTTIDTKDLKNTGEYIYDNKIKLDINNNGVQLNLYTIIKNQKEENNE
ncbi:MAG: anti-sigma factor domain-containing protein [Clostridium sp.]